MATEVVDVCNNKYCTGTIYKCNLCVERMLALALERLQELQHEFENKVRILQDYEKKVRFLQAYEPGPLSESFRGDVSFIGTDLKPVFAHRFIMAGKSSVFRKMFDIVMKDKESGTVQVNDAVAPVLRSMVKYCYTADIMFTEEAPAEEVLKLAHKYDINELKAVCESELSRGINNENLCNRIRLGDIYVPRSWMQWQPGTSRKNSKVYTSSNAMATEVFDVCNNNFCKGSIYTCNVCVDRIVALAQEPLHELEHELPNKVRELQDYENKVRFLQAYEPGPLSKSFRGDVSFIGTDLEPVFAHRFIMAGKSSIFRKVFDIDMKEKESGSVQVNDAVAPVLRSMVNYCYTSNIIFTEEAPVYQVLELALKFDIKELKAVCERIVSEDLCKLREGLCKLQ